VKTNLRQLYGACILAFASEDDEIMNSALRAFEAELPEIAKTVEEVNLMVIIGEIRGDKPYRWVRLDEVLGGEAEAQ